MTSYRYHFLGLLLACSWMITVGNAEASDQVLALQATLVWGTNDGKPADAKLKPVDAEVALKLGKLPFKWSHYYAVESKEFLLAPGEKTEVTMSEECEILVKALDAETVELSLRGKGKLVGKVTQKLSNKEMLVTGGNAENLTSWFVVLRRVKPQ